MFDIIHDHLCDTYKRNRFTPKGAEWPSNQPRLIASLTLFFYDKGKTIIQELHKMDTIHKKGAPAINEFSFQGPSSKKPGLEMTTNITDIFAVDPTDLTETGKMPKRILIEGAPGIGKTVLAEEIAYQWATNELLTEIKIVFLLHLHDPHLQSITNTRRLIEYMSMGCLDDEQIATLTDCLRRIKGQQLCIMIDGFNEYPASLQINSYILRIIKRQILPEAIVVITSRPTSTALLHHVFDRRVDILGLSKEEQDKYISQVFINSPERGVELVNYLEQHPVVNGLCYVPLYLAILLYLFQLGSLPETLTELNNSFILHTIYRHFEKHELTPPYPVNKLADVPKPVLDIVYKLSELAFKGLQENKLVFTFDEIIKICPHIDKIAGATNGFGLLQAVQHYSHKGVGTAMSFNFLHFTMQEFLAALHLTILPIERQSSLMEMTFWNGNYNNMWIMFVGIVGVKSNVFVNFISKGKVYRNKSGIRIAKYIVKDKRKCSHLLQCYREAKSCAEAPAVLLKNVQVILYRLYIIFIISLLMFCISCLMYRATLASRVHNK